MRALAVVLALRAQPPLLPRRPAPPPAAQSAAQRAELPADWPAEEHAVPRRLSPTPCIEDSRGDINLAQLPNAALTRLRRDRKARDLNTSRVLDEPACADAQLPHAARRFMAYAQEEANNDGLIMSLPVPPAVLQKNLTLIVVSLEIGSEGLKDFAQEMLCGLDRLGLKEQTVVVGVDHGSAETSKQLGFFTVYDLKFKQFVENVGRRSKVAYDNRITKLVAALGYLEKGYKVLVSDVDTMWIESPIPYFESLDVDFVGSRDYCWTDINTGLLYYRPTAAVFTMLRTALGYVKNEDHDTDNDQYVLNCAWPYAAQDHGLKYAFADSRVFFRNLPGCMSCNGCAKLPIWVYDPPAWGAKGRNMALTDPNLPRPLVWHFGGMTEVAQIRDRNESGEHIQHGAWGIVLKVKRIQSSNHEGAQCKAPRSKKETSQLRKNVRFGCGVAYHPECRGECTPSVDDFMFAAKQIEDLGETMGWLEKMDPRLVPSKEKRLWTEQFKKLKVNDIAAICAKATAQKKEIRSCWDAVIAHPPEALVQVVNNSRLFDFMEGAHAASLALGTCIACSVAGAATCVRKFHLSARLVLFTVIVISCFVLIDAGAESLLMDTKAFSVTLTEQGGA